MGILDKLKQATNNTNAGSAEEKGVDEAGKLLDEKTGNKYTSQIDAGENQAKQAMGLDPQAQQDPNAQSSPTDDTEEQPPAG